LACSAAPRYLRSLANCAKARSVGTKHARRGASVAG
jgi:hypothetical protein